MSPFFRLQGRFILIFLVALRGESRYLEVSGPLADYRTSPGEGPALGGGQGCRGAGLGWG